MANLDLNKEIQVTIGGKAKPQVTVGYGPYSSVETAHSEHIAIYGTEANIPLGLKFATRTTVGSATKITEYIYSTGTTLTGVKETNDIAENLDPNTLIVDEDTNKIKVNFNSDYFDTTDEVTLLLNGDTIIPTPDGIKVDSTKLMYDDIEGTSFITKINNVEATVGNTEELKTTNKTSTVEAINEVVDSLIVNKEVDIANTPTLPFTISGMPTVGQTYNITSGSLEAGFKTVFTAKAGDTITLKSSMPNATGVFILINGATSLALNAQITCEYVISTTDETVYTFARDGYFTLGVTAGLEKAVLKTVGAGSLVDLYEKITEKENISNKTSDINTYYSSEEKYPTVKGVVDYVAAQENCLLIFNINATSAKHVLDNIAKHLILVYTSTTQKIHIPLSRVELGDVTKVTFSTIYYNAEENAHYSAYITARKSGTNYSWDSSTVTFTKLAF